MSLQLTEHQDRYDECVQRQLEIEYCRLVKTCQAKNISLADDLLRENGGRENFIQKAVSSGYVLGQFVEYDESAGFCSLSGLSFVDRAVFSISVGWGYNRKENKRVNFYSQITNTPNMHGFGIKLTLRGWKIFIGINCKSFTYRKFQTYLDNGFSVEEIFGTVDRRGYRRTKVSEPKLPYGGILFKGELLTANRACEKAKVSKSTFYKATNRIFDVKTRQAIFDKLVSLKKRKT